MHYSLWWRCQECSFVVNPHRAVQLCSTLSRDLSISRIYLPTSTRRGRDEVLRIVQIRARVVIPWTYYRLKPPARIPPLYWISYNDEVDRGVLKAPPQTGNIGELIFQVAADIASRGFLGQKGSCLWAPDSQHSCIIARGYFIGMQMMMLAQSFCSMELLRVKSTWS